jgi:hypothetical protein
MPTWGLVLALQLSILFLGVLAWLVFVLVFNDHYTVWQATQGDDGTLVNRCFNKTTNRFTRDSECLNQALPKLPNHAEPQWLCRAGPSTPWVLCTGDAGGWDHAQPLDCPAGVASRRREVQCVRNGTVQDDVTVCPGPMPDRVRPCAQRFRQAEEGGEPRCEADIRGPHGLLDNCLSAQTRNRTRWRATGKGTWHADSVDADVEVWSPVCQRNNGGKWVQAPTSRCGDLTPPDGPGSSYLYQDTPVVTVMITALDGTRHFYRAFHWVWMQRTVGWRCNESERVQGVHQDTTVPCYLYAEDCPCPTTGTPVPDLVGTVWTWNSADVILNEIDRVAVHRARVVVMDLLHCLETAPTDDLWRRLRRMPAQLVIDLGGNAAVAVREAVANWSASTVTPNTFNTGALVVLRTFTWNLVLWVLAAP